jgi:ribonuclease Z
VVLAATACDTLVPSCHQGPSIRSSCPSVGLRLGRSQYLVDCGEGTQRQIMRSFIRTGKLKAIFITHMHGDHIFG